MPGEILIQGTGEVHLRHIPQGRQPRGPAAQGGVEAGVEEAFLGSEGAELPAGELKRRTTAPDVVEVQPQAVRPHDEGAVQVDLVSARAHQAASLAKAPIEPRPGLRELPPVAGGDQHLRGSIELRGAHQQVNVTEGPQRRIGIVQVGDRRPLEDPMIDTPLLQERGPPDKGGLEGQGRHHRGTVCQRRLLPLIGRRGQCPLPNGPY